MIHISRQVDYAWQFLGRLLRTPNSLISLPAYSKESTISPLFMQKIARKLRQAGLIKAAKGPGGGYGLAVPAAQITLKRVLEAMEGPYYPLNCLDKTGPGCPNAGCPAQPAWHALHKRINTILETTTMADT
ncbi:MAG: Transcriptional regulator, Rrf2 family [Candidatus Magasanikbacteria bacterium GW2011_GWA2_56_11]|uniref:Transcriptional regulator, Rrf2 family n=1 Tax=Candidatus Magasanikbacteria bacterium GW2011_GWA2_56_11 TaxID=1619044 RepID=A0A0G1YGI0_9BACT|nr:MAG: Transcriptional regulator, Rrf2 family [Candidatus Magasanikbacteria bacterium GW2011_GWA2_56_11]